MSEPTMQPSLQPGDKVGYYQVKAPIGAGGMSLVWQGFDQLMNRQVAIKQIAEISSTDEEMRTKMKQEANIHKQVSAGCPNIVDIIELIEEERGIFLIMEFVDGLNLESILMKKAEPLPPAQVLPIIHQIAVALNHIHQAGIIHRDLKPANILMNRNGEVKVTDFGIATMIDDQENMDMGTARYMAPELFTSGNADFRADMYSLGFIAYEMLAGRAKFEESFKSILRDPRSQALRWMKWHTNARLMPPDLSGMVDLVSPQLTELIQRMMNKDHNQRIPDMATLNQVLIQNFSAEAQARQAQQQQAMVAEQQIKEQQMVQASANPTAVVPQKNRTPLYIAVAVGAVLLIGGIAAATMLGGGDSEKIDKENILRIQGKSVEAWNTLAAIQNHPDTTEFETARTSLTNANKELENGQLAEKAKSLKMFNDARIAMLNMRINKFNGDKALNEIDFKQAATLYSQALEQCDIAADTEDQRKSVTSKTETANKFIAQIDQYKKSITQSLDFAEICQKANERIAEGNFKRARNRIEAIPDVIKRDPSDNEKVIINQLLGKLTGAISDKEIVNLIAEGRKFYDLGVSGYQQYIEYVNRVLNVIGLKEDPRVQKEITLARQLGNQITVNAQYSAATTQYNEAVTSVSDAYARAVAGTITQRIITETRKSLSDASIALTSARTYLSRDLPPEVNVSIMRSTIDRNIDTVSKHLDKLDVITSDDIEKMKAYVKANPQESDIPKLISDYEANKEIRDLVKQIRELTLSEDFPKVIREMPAQLAKLPTSDVHTPIRREALAAINNAKVEVALKKALEIKGKNPDVMTDTKAWQDIINAMQTVLDIGDHPTASSAIAHAKDVLSVQSAIKNLETMMESNKDRRKANEILRTFQQDVIDAATNLTTKEKGVFENKQEYIKKVSAFYLPFNGANAGLSSTSADQLLNSKKQAETALGIAPSDKHAKMATDLIKKIEKAISALEN